MIHYLSSLFLQDGDISIPRVAGSPVDLMVNSKEGVIKFIFKKLSS